MNYIYFETMDGGMVTNYNLITMAMVVEGKALDAEDLDSVREYAKSCKGIKGEIKNPSVETFVRCGEYVKAVQYLSRTNPEIDVKEAKALVDEIKERVASEKRDKVTIVDRNSLLDYWD